MRIIVHDHAGHPFQVQLSRELARRGHDVLHIFRGDEITPHGALTKTENDPDKFDVCPLTASSPIKKYSLAKRWFQEREYGEIFSNQIESFKPDIVFSANTPLEAQYKGLKFCKANGIKFVHWWTDFTGYTAKAILTEKLKLFGYVPGYYFIALEKKITQMSDHTIITTEDHYEQCDKWNLRREDVSVIHNWAPLSEYPIRPRDNDWAKSNGTVGKVCFMWTGTLGFKHNPGLLLDLARKYKDSENIEVLVVSESIGARWLKEQKETDDLPNLRILGFQPYEDVPDMMASADVLVASVNNEVSFYAVPSKVLSYMCSGRPVLLGIDEGNLAARILKDNWIGIVVDPQDSAAFLAGAERLCSDREMSINMGLNGRKYAEENYDVTKITGKFEAIMDQLCTPVGAT